MQKGMDIHEFVQGVYFEFINSLKNNGTKNLLISDSCAEYCNSKEFVDISTAADIAGLVQNTLNTTYSTKVS